MKPNKLFLLVAICLCACAPKEQMLPRAIEPALANEFDKVFNDVRDYTTNELHSLIVVKDGKVIYERYEPGHEPGVLHIMWSASKTFTATAIGFAVQDGLLSVDDKVTGFFTEEELPDEISPWLAQMTVKNLLTMSSGFDPIHAGLPRYGDDYDWAQTELNRPLYFEPGTMYRYDSFDSYLLSVIVSRVTGMRMDEYLDGKLFRPLGITGWYWESSPQNYSSGGWGLYLKPESFTKMGQFLLQEGVWNGKRLLNAEWVREASQAHIMQYAGTNPTPEQLEEYAKDDKKMGYGYQCWISPYGGYRLDGAWGQNCYVYPEKNLVVCCFAHTKDTKLMRNSLYEHIISKF